MSPGAQSESGTSRKVIGVPVFTNTAYYSFKTAELCKKARPDIKVVLGGVHATALPDLSLKECPSADYVVVGEGEITFYELVDRIEKGEPTFGLPGLASRNLEGNFICNGNRELIKDLDELPMTYYDEIDLARYVPHPTQYKVLPNFPLLTQRGCPYKCTFCDASLVHGRQVRHISSGRIIKELELLVAKHGAKGIYFQDSTFTINRAYVVELCNKIIEKKLKLQWACNTRCDRVDLELLKLMKKAGCWMINYGIESANQKSLDMLNKSMSLEKIEQSVSETKMPP